MQARFEFRSYQRSFQRPLQTHHGEWTTRQGVLLRLTAADRIGWGEIAPIQWFGSESWETALAFCQDLGQSVCWQQIQQIPLNLPACQFGFEAAWEDLHKDLHRVEPPENQAADRPAKQHPDRPTQQPQVSILLPTGADALTAPQLFTAQPYSTFKWKIGVDSIAAELAIFEDLIGLLPPQAKLRLDANGSLTWQQASQWLQVCDGYGIEFLEQPLPPNQFNLMLKLSDRHSTPIALDESVTTLAQLKTCYERGWRGIFVIKAPIAGSPTQLKQFCQAHPLDLVWSSVFETPIARRYIQQHLIAVSISNRALGFGVDQWFGDRWERYSPEQLWQQCL